MKISLFLFGVICCMFFISTQNIYSMKRKHTEQNTQSSRATKIQKTDIQQDVSEESEACEESSQDANDYIKKIRPIRLRTLFFEAERYFDTGELESALPIYEKIIGESNDPLALFRLGEIYQKMAEEEPKLLTKSFDFYKLALDNGFIPAIPKLLEIGEALNEMIKESHSKPMSVEVQQMYS